MWGFPKIGAPNMVPLNSRILIIRTPNKVPLIFGNSHVLSFWVTLQGGLWLVPTWRSMDKLGLQVG